MARPRRENPEGGLYHVWARGNNRERVFFDDVDRVEYLSRLGRMVGEGYFRCLAYCLMSNHLHLILETEGPSLGNGMRRLHGRYAQVTNQRHGRVGHVFEKRFGSTAILDEGHAAMAIRYVALNPVAAGLCRRPEDWAWSSCAATLSERGGPTWLDVGRLLGLFHWLGGVPGERYRELVAPD